MILGLLNQPIDFIFLLIALLVAITFHEFAHAATAVFLGDITPKLQGRLTLNPIKHLDFLGTIFLLIAGFGWGKPVPFIPHFIKHGRWGIALIGFSGPLTNIFISFIFILTLKFGVVPPVFAELFLVIILINIILAIFNLLPIPPLDGSKILQAFVPESKLKWIKILERQGPMILLFILILDRFLGIPILSSIINPILKFVTNLSFSFLV